MAGAPLWNHVVDDQRPAQTTDLARGEAVPGVGGGQEDQPGVERAGSTADQISVGIEDILDILADLDQAIQVANGSTCRERAATESVAAQ